MIFQGDSLAVLRNLPQKSVHCCVTSPPYYNLRDYGIAGQIGLEPTPEAYIKRLVEVFREVRRVLKDDGTLWLNLGDSYAAKRGIQPPPTNTKNKHGHVGNGRVPAGFKSKDLLGMPWRMAFALQADGWYLRSDIIWNKPNPMPESVRDRPTRAHEYLFLLAKSEKYYYDYDAIQEPIAESSKVRLSQENIENQAGTIRTNGGTRADRPFKPVVGRRSGNMKRTYGEDRGRPGSHIAGSVPWEGTARNKRTVWTVTTVPFKGAHFATFPPKLIEPCILAGAPIGGTVLDPFFGAGTVGLVAKQHGRDYIGIELNPEYIELSRKRLGGA